VKQTPILFNDEMVREILAGHKTMTRRAIKPQPVQPSDGSYFDAYNGGPQWNWWASDNRQHLDQIIRCPYGKPGDRLWVREAHAFVPQTAYRCSTGIYQQVNPNDNYEACVYRQNFDRSRSFPWRPSIHMPRWASRITLEITDVRVERLQDISEKDAKAEGVSGEAEAAESGLSWHDKPLRAFRFLWQSINGPESWEKNPWVWVVEFKRVDSAGYY
jgi:hypothetical protein